MRVAPLLALLVASALSCTFTGPLPQDDPPPEVSFLADGSQTDEEDAAPEVELQLSRASAESVVVELIVTNGSAADGADYSLGRTVTFPAGATRARVELAVRNDGIEEDEEDVELSIRRATGAVVGAGKSHRLAIASQILPRVRFAAATSSAMEPAGVQSFTIELTRAAPAPVRVRYLWTGTAEPADHGLVTGDLEIPAGQTRATLAVPIVNDPTDEDDETVDVTLIAQAGAVVAAGGSRHLHTIVDDDPPPTVAFTSSGSSIGEGGGSATLRVALQRVSEKPITVDYAVVGGGTAIAADYTLADGTLAFAPGVAALDLPVGIINDALDELDETVRLDLRSPSEATLGGMPQHQLTIVDDDLPPQLRFAAATSSIGEGGGTSQVAVELATASGLDVTFSLLRGGTATAADATVALGPFTIPAGSLQVSIPVSITNDAIDEVDETVILTLTAINRATAGTPSTHTLSIVDDDEPPVVRFDPGVPDMSAAEGNTADVTYSYPVVLSAPSGRTVSVGVVRTGTASASDLSIPAADLPVVFQPGETSKAIRLTIRAGTALEPDETVVLTLQTPANNTATSAADNQVRTHTIVNDD